MLPTHTIFVPTGIFTVPFVVSTLPVWPLPQLLPDWFITETGFRLHA